MKNKAFKNFKHNGLHLTFPNGNFISTIWGSGSYTENHDRGFEEPYKLDAFQKAYNSFLESEDVEVMITCPDKLYKKIYKKFGNGDDSVIGHLNIKQWLAILNLLAK